MIENENEAPYDLTLSSRRTVSSRSRRASLVVVNSIPENSAVGSVVGTIRVRDDDAGADQTLTFTTNNDLFTIAGNQLILASQLNHDLQQSILLYIRATDNGQPPTFVSERRFVRRVIKGTVLDGKRFRHQCNGGQSAADQRDIDSDGALHSQGFQ